MHYKISSNYSPNFTTSKRIKNNIKYLIFHYTGMRSETKAINWLTNVKSKVSSNYFIKRNGQIICLVPETAIGEFFAISFATLRVGKSALPLFLGFAGGISIVTGFFWIQKTSLQIF